MADRETGWFRGGGGAVWQMDMPLDETMQEQVTKGYLHRVNEDGSLYVEPSDEVAEPAPAAEQAPAAYAPKANWVGYAHRVHGVPVDDADAMTKNDLIEKYGPKP